MKRYQLKMELLDLDSGRKLVSTMHNDLVEDLLAYRDIDVLTEILKQMKREAEEIQNS